MPSDLPNVLEDGKARMVFHDVLVTLFGHSDPAQSHAPELWVSLVFFIMWVGLRFGAFRFLLLHLCRSAGASSPLVEYKCSVLVWNGIFHTWSTLWLYSWLPLHRWYYDTEYLWEEVENPDPTHRVKMEVEFKAFYMIQLGYHLQSIVWHSFEERRPDHVVMAVHHIVTVLLIVGSWLSQYQRIGLLVLLVHDASDVFVCACKASHMCGWKKTSHTLFVFMVLSWAYYRLWLYPTWVVSSVLSYPENKRYNLSWWLFTGGMSVLLLLHMWWFHLFIKMAIGIAQNGPTGGKDLTENEEIREQEHDVPYAAGEASDTIVCVLPDAHRPKEA